MWDRGNRRHLYGNYRTAPPKLIPAVITCQASGCLIIFGIFVLIAGCVSRFVAGDDSPPSKAFDTPFFNEHRTEFSKTPRLIGSILMTIGGIMIGCAIICIIIAFVFYQKYENERRKQMQIPSQILTNYEASAPPLGGVDYPTAGFQYNHGYQPVSQNIVYNPTTEPNHNVI